MAEFTARLDTRAQDAFLRRYKPDAVDRILTEAAAAGAKAGVNVLRNRAPTGSSSHPSQYYRRNGLGHGTFRKSVKAAKIRGRRGAINIQGKTVGYVMGPMGKNAFTRSWREAGTNGPGRHHVRGLHWTEAAAGQSFSVARGASEGILVRYAKATR